MMPMMIVYIVKEMQRQWLVLFHLGDDEDW